MLLTAVAQLRLAASVAFGLPLAPWALDRLVESLLATRREFGAVAPEGASLVTGVPLDDPTRRAMQLRRFRQQAARGARETAHYGRLFAGLGLDPGRLTTEDVARLPLTPKAALRDDPGAFVRRGAGAAFRTTTTGTTGRPTSVYFTARELETTAALTALGLLLHGQLGPEDVVQVSTSARATLGNTCLARACARIGALWALTGLVEPRLALAQLTEAHRVPGKRPRPSYLVVYPSYLGELVERGLAAGLGPADFGLERIAAGGEVVTSGLKARARRLFGDAVAFDEGYAQTETWPLGGVRCEAGHLHFEPSRGLVEVLALPEAGPGVSAPTVPAPPDPSAPGVPAPPPAAPGAPGMVVATPFAPYREASVVLRYATEDVVRAVAGPPACALRHLPATGVVLGKLRLAVRHGAGPEGWTFPRQVLEALEAADLADAVPLPARCGVRAVPGGVAVEALVRPGQGDLPAVRRAVGARLEAQGVPLRELCLVEDPARLRRPLPLRGDLRERSFAPPAGPPTPAGPANGRVPPAVPPGAAVPTGA
jgi:phenylacetate-coenzyme A ligase PaaK-like adenylate-forming protein